MCYRIDGDFIYLSVYVKPKSQESAIVGVRNNNLAIALNALPDNNQANNTLIKMLSKHFNLAKNTIFLIKGMKSRYKIVQLPYFKKIEFKLQQYI